MSDLDKKLEEALLETVQFTHDNGNNIQLDVKAAVQAVKQAFIDDGWVKVPHNAKYGVTDAMLRAQANEAAFYHENMADRMRRDRAAQRLANGFKNQA